MHCAAHVIAIIIIIVAIVANNVIMNHTVLVTKFLFASVE